jgi:AcrR family transcriptional regulator
LSGVSKTTLYRHWPSKGALALDGYFALVGREIEVRDSGNVRADLVDVLSRFITVLQRSAVRTAFTQLIGQAQSDADLADSFSEHYFGPRRAAVTGLLEAAQTRGEIRADADIPTVIDALWGAVYVRLLLPNLREDLTVAFATRVVDTVLEGVGAEGLE